jgi:D-arabinose 1-dehydrogenase-like Zn-dependent alcohol dehydrogenase
MTGLPVCWLCLLYDCTAKPMTLFPNELSATELTPIMCAGITTYNALDSDARVGMPSL